MAVQSSLEFKKFKASVVVDGHPLPCHASFVDKKEKSVSCWIASEESKHFLVRLKREEKTCSIRVSLFLDGKRVKRKFLGQKEAGTTLRFDRVQTSRDTTRPFKFAPLEVTDDDKYLDASLLSSDNVQKIGEITIEVHRVTRLKYVKKFREEKLKEHDYSRNNLQVQMVHETSKKAITMSHQIRYGEEREISHSNDTCRSSVEYSGIKELIAKFTFRYRPIETLLLCGIVPPLLRPVEAKEKEAQHSQELEPQLPVEHQLTRDQDDRREDSLDDIYVPPLAEPIAAISTEDTNMHNKSGEHAPLSNSQQDIEETKLGLISDEEYEDENDEEVKALQARTLMLLEEKRKRREAVQGPRKRIKLEEAPLVFFRPGEVKEVIDLT